MSRKDADQSNIPEYIQQIILPHEKLSIPEFLKFPLPEPVEMGHE